MPQKRHPLSHQAQVTGRIITGFAADARNKNDISNILVFPDWISRPLELPVELFAGEHQLGRPAVRAVVAVLGQVPLT